MSTRNVEFNSDLLAQDTKHPAEPLPPPPDKEPAPTHLWWQGAGPEIRLTLSRDDERRAAFDPSFIAQRRRQEQAKKSHVFVSLRLAPDHLAIEEAFVVLYPSDPNWAVLSDSPLRDRVNGHRLGVAPFRFHSGQRAILDADGGFNLAGFLQAPRPNPANPYELSEWKLETVKHVLSGRLTADTLGGTFYVVLGSSPRADPIQIHWKGAYDARPDAEVAKDVTAREEAFVDPELRRLGEEGYKVEQWARKLSLPRETAREWLRPQDRIERVEKSLARASDWSNRDRHLKDLVDIHKNAADFVRRDTSLQSLADSLNDLTLTAAGDVATVAQLSMWVRQATRQKLDKIDKDVARGLALTVRLMEYARYAPSRPAEVEALIRRYRPKTELPEARAVEDRVLASEAAELQRLQSPAVLRSVRRFASMSDMKTLGDVMMAARTSDLNDVAPTDSRRRDIKYFADEVATVRAMAVLNEVARLCGLTPEETVFWAAVCLERGGVGRSFKVRSRATQLLSDKLRDRPSAAAAVQKLAPPPGVKSEEDEEVEKRFPRPGKFGEDAAETALYRRLAAQE